MEDYTTFVPSAPVQRRLTKIYNDTKTISDFIKEPVRAGHLRGGGREDPARATLHRKLKIQKDRLVSWGLEWSDATTAASSSSAATAPAPDIDESITKAGLGELVGSVMSTIKEILAEAEPLWQSSKHVGVVGGAGDDEGHGGDDDDDGGDDPLHRGGRLTWDRARFEDLIRDLTMSIDTLFDLSKTRQANRQLVAAAAATAGPGARKKGLIPPAVPVEEKQFESSRMATPQQIDPATIIWPESLPSRALNAGEDPSPPPRRIVFMRRPNRSSLAKPGAHSAVLPVLLEYAPYDPIYSITGIPPPMSRFERLFAGLSSAWGTRDRPMTGLLPLIGYYEEAERSRLCLLFSLPSRFGPVDVESPALRAPRMATLTDLLVPVYEPSLEIRFRLASNIANSVFDLHAKGALHGQLVPANIVLFFRPAAAPDDVAAAATTDLNMRHSFLASFDLFSDHAPVTETPGETSTSASSVTSLSRHPLDPRLTRYTNLTLESKSLDLYSLALLLLQIGMWATLDELFPETVARVRHLPREPKELFHRLTLRCGSVYSRAVQACWRAPEDELSKAARPDVMHQKVVWRVSKALDACCAIDEVSESDPSDGESTSASGSSAATSLRAKGVSGTTSAAWDQRPPPFPAAPQEDVIRDWSEKPVLAKPKLPTPEQIVEWTRDAGAVAAATSSTSAKSKPKLRTYPAIRISPEHLHFWHTVLMPHINHVLRGFYRKYPESVEISLESIGESSSRTQPTILVICTSVNKVRSILKKNLVYDKATYGLKVCRGKVVRSRKQDDRRSMARDQSIAALNTEHQSRPLHGASIGAFVGEKHLAPVSFGGTLLVDDKPFGMTVHHMLDDPSDAEDDEKRDDDKDATRSAAAPSLSVLPSAASSSSAAGAGDDMYSYPLSDDGESAGYISDSEAFSEYETTEDEREDFNGVQPGDRAGIRPEDVGPDDYLVTQPALDDVPGDFYPSPETRDEDHLDTFTLGSIHCSSGIRRRASSISGAVVHEIDWALFSFLPERLPQTAHTPAAIGVARNKELPGMYVSSTGRTSGYKRGRIQNGMSIVKMAGRATPAASWTVVGGMGVPGDSGAWVLSDSGPRRFNEGPDRRVAGSILAYSARKGCAYICPMDVAISDIAEALNATRIALPGGDIVYDALSSPVTGATRHRPASWRALDTTLGRGRMSQSSSSSRGSAYRSLAEADHGSTPMSDDRRSSASKSARHYSSSSSSYRSQDAQSPADYRPWQQWRLGRGSSSLQSRATTISSVSDDAGVSAEEDGVKDEEEEPSHGRGMADENDPTSAIRGQASSGQRASMKTSRSSLARASSSSYSPSDSPAPSPSSCSFSTSCRSASLKHDTADRSRTSTSTSISTSISTSASSTSTCRPSSIKDALRTSHRDSRRDSRPSMLVASPGVTAYTASSPRGQAHAHV